MKSATVLGIFTILSITTPLSLAISSDLISPSNNEISTTSSNSQSIKNNRMISDETLTVLNALSPSPFSVITVKTINKMVNTTLESTNFTPSKNTTYANNMTKVSFFRLPSIAQTILDLLHV